MSSNTLADRIDALLPQTQCTKCGYDGCRPYADALAQGQADINRCPPGGEDGVRALATLLDQAPLPLDTSRGVPGPLMVAVIDEAHCIGCTLCIDACPVDAIVGAAKRMHTVLDDLCTGCDLCVAPCPVDCIAMAPAGRAWTAADARQARERHDRRSLRMSAGNGGDGRRAADDLADNSRSNRVNAEGSHGGINGATEGHDAAARKRAAIQDALALARARRSAVPK
jgi:electron transport complex protein RnfB